MHAFCRTYLPDWPNHRPWIWGSQSCNKESLCRNTKKSSRGWRLAARYSSPSLSLEAVYYPTISWSGLDLNRAPWQRVGCAPPGQSPRQHGSTARGQQLKPRTTDSRREHS